MPGLAPYKVILSANQRKIINARGTTAFLRAATGEISVTLRSTATGSRDGVAYTLNMTEAEEWQHAEEFDSVEIENQTAVANTIEFYIGYGNFSKPVPDIVNVAVTVSASRTLFTLVDDSAFGVGQGNKTIIAPEDLNRKSIVCTALSTNAGIIRLGNSAVDTNQGVPLSPGESIRIESTDDIFACEEAAGVNAVALFIERVE